MNPDNRSKVLAFIKTFQSPYGKDYGPMQKEIALAIGISHVAVHQHVRALEQAGIVKRRAKVGNGKARLVCLVQVAA